MNEILDIFTEFRRRFPYRVYGAVPESELQKLENQIAVTLPEACRYFIRECGVARATCDYLGYFPSQGIGVDFDLSMIESTLVLRKNMRLIMSNMDNFHFQMKDNISNELSSNIDKLVSVSMDPMGGVNFIISDPELPDQTLYYFNKNDREVVVDPECPLLSRFWQYMTITLEYSQVDVDETILLDCWEPGNRRLRGDSIGE